MLGRIFGPRRDEVTGGWRGLHEEELYSSVSEDPRQDRDIPLGLPSKYFTTNK
jgi:hypothetical protein